MLDGGRVVQHGPARPAGRASPAPFRDAARRPPPSEHGARRRPRPTARRRRGRHRPAHRRRRPRRAELRDGPGPGPRDHVDAAHRAAVGPGRHGAVPGLRPVRRVRCDHRLDLGPPRRRPCRTASNPVALTGALVVSLMVQPAAARRGDPPLPALVDRGDAAGAHRRARRADRTSTGCERTPPGEVVARTMDADRLARYADRWVDFVNGLAIAAVTALVGAEPARRRRAARRDGGLRARLLARPPGGRPFGGGLGGRAGAVRPLAGLRARLRAHRQARRLDARRPRATCARSTAAASTPPSASTACRRCSTASRS